MSESSWFFITELSLLSPALSPASSDGPADLRDPLQLSARG